MSLPAAEWNIVFVFASLKGERAGATLKITATPFLVHNYCPRRGKAKKKKKIRKVIMK